jgi:hypothetical protein
MPDPRAILDSDAIEADAEKTLATFRNYLAATSAAIDVRYRGAGGRLKQLAAAQASLPGFQRLRSRQQYDREQVRGVLFNAWHTEVALALPEALDDPGLARFTNQWGPVQAYYATYCLWRAWFLTERRAVRTHGAALKQVSGLVTGRNLLPFPWSCSSRGGPTLAEAEHLGFAEAVLRDVSALTRPPGEYTTDEWIAKLLRTTRGHFLKERESKWKAENRTRSGRPYARIPPDERRRIREQLHSTTLFDFLYRLRIRANYGDVDDFVVGQLSDDDAQTYFRSLLDVTRKTMQTVEAMIRRSMRTGEFDQMAVAFLRRAGGRQHSRLPSRLDAYQHADEAAARE